MGKAIKSAEPINAANAQATLNKVLEDVVPLFQLKDDEYFVLGSICKTQYKSSDIDLAVNQDAVPSVHDCRRRLRQIYPEVVFNSGIGVLSSKIPIVNSDGLQPYSHTQLDMMFVGDIRMARFYYHSPSWLETHYRAEHRNILLNTAASFAGMLNLEYAEVERDGKQVQTPVTWRRYYLDPHGLSIGVQTIKDRNGLPSQRRQTLSKEFITNDPAEILFRVLGEKATFRDTTTFERLLQFMKGPDYVYKCHLKKIRSRVRNICRDAKIVVPREL